MKNLIKQSFIKFLTIHGLFIDSGEGIDRIRCMLNEILGDIYKVSEEYGCKNWVNVFIEVRDELLDNKEVLSIMIEDDLFFYLLPEDKYNLFDNLFKYSVKVH